MTSSSNHDIQFRLPAKEMLFLASDIIYALDQQLIADEERELAAGNEEQAHEYLKQRGDLSLTQYMLDPYSWALDRARHGREVKPEEENPDPNERVRNLFDLVNIVKSQVIIHKAIALRRKTRKLEGEEAEKEDAMLDFILFLCTHGKSRDLFKIIDQESDQQLNS